MDEHDTPQHTETHQCRDTAPHTDGASTTLTIGRLDLRCPVPRCRRSHSGERTEGRKHRHEVTARRQRCDQDVGERYEACGEGNRGVPPADVARGRCARSGNPELADEHARSDRCQDAEPGAHGEPHQPLHRLTRSAAPRPLNRRGRVGVELCSHPLEISSIRVGREHAQPGERTGVEDTKRDEHCNGHRCHPNDITAPPMHCHQGQRTEHWDDRDRNATQFGRDGQTARDADDRSGRCCTPRRSTTIKMQRSENGEPARECDQRFGTEEVRVLQGQRARRVQRRTDEPRRSAGERPGDQRDDNDRQRVDQRAQQPPDQFDLVPVVELGDAIVVDQWHPDRVQRLRHGQRRLAALIYTGTQPFCGVARHRQSDRAVGKGLHHAIWIGRRRVGVEPVDDWRQDRAMAVDGLFASHRIRHDRPISFIGMLVLTMVEVEIPCPTNETDEHDHCECCPPQPTSLHRRRAAHITAHPW